MRLFQYACLGAALWWVATTAAHAQIPAAFSGDWTVTWEGAKRPQQARMVITESGGWWKTFAYSREDPCVGRKVPVELEAFVGDKVRFRLNYSEALRGCADVVIYLRKLDDKTLTGRRGKAVLTATRQ